MNAVGNVRRAHAKLTWTLRVTGVRANGFHLLDSEMVSLDLHDTLTFDTSGDGLAMTGPFADGIAADDSNLIARALRSAGRTAHVTVDKHIPHGGGLGGGSTDAAATLRWAGTGIEDTSLVAASAIGADVPFCMVGGRARVRGIGELVEPLPHVDRTITLVVPPLTVSTPAVYRAWDDLGGPRADGPNDLEPAARRVEPRLNEWKRLIESAVGEPPILAGSGATWFLPGERANALVHLEDEGAVVRVVRTVSAAVARGDQPLPTG